MIGLTLAVTVVAVALVLWLRPGRGLAVLLACILLYPDYLRVPIGLAQMSAARFVAAALLAKLILAGRASRFRWHWIDGLVFAGWAWGVLANVVAGATQSHLVWMIGNGLDTVLMYFCVRLALLHIGNAVDLVAPLAACLLLLGALGVVESVTYWSPFTWLRAYQIGVWFEKPPEFRFGFLRAQVNTGHPIYFGMVMVMATGLLYAMRGFANRAWVWHAGCAGGLAAVASSLSSGPQGALMVLAGTAAFQLRPRWIKPAVGLAVVGCVLFEVLSHRHFYNIVDYLNVSGGGAWYRTRLLEVAVSRLHEYWLLGFAGNWPHHWGALIDGRSHVDVVNHYLVTAVYAGLPAALLLLATQAMAIRESVRTWRSAPPYLRKLVFRLACTLLGVMFGSLSVGLYGTSVMLLFMITAVMVRPGSAALARIGAAPDIRRRVAEMRRLAEPGRLRTEATQGEKDTDLRAR